jgi:non-specific serine/threonine protein kinase
VTAIYRFGRFELKPATRQLLIDDQPALLGARALDVLLALIERRDRLVTKAELLDLVWPGVVVEENNLQVQISTLRKLLGQDAIATVAGRGYRFVLESTDAAGPQAPPQPQVPKHNLPEQVASFIGREREITELRQLLACSRLVTLVGVGGVGKTQLGLRAAANLMDAFPDGVWFVELAPISDAALLPNAVNHALGVSAGARRSHEDALQEFLRTKQLLLLIDNCEHLIEACARLTHQLLVQCPQLKVLATSREALSVPGEVTFAVQPLAVPDPSSFRIDPTALQTASENESVRLFIDRARAVRPDFTITMSNATAVAEICLRLDGIPLAIELAAARAKALGPQEILSRLDDRFRLLTGGGRAVLPRQQTLRATIDWSYDLLTEPERALFRRLSVFAGGCTLAAAEVVGNARGSAAASVLDLLSHLVDKSLVIAREGGVESRYNLLETVRQYGDTRLREADESGLARDAHLGYFLQFAKAAEPHLRDTGQGEWLQRLQAETDNLRAALEWACSAGRTQSGLALARVLGSFWHIRSDYSEGRYWLQRIEELPDAAGYPDDFAWVLYFDGVMAIFLADTERSHRLLKRSRALAKACGNRRCEVYALEFQGTCALMEADFEKAKAWIAECEPMFHEIGDRWGIAVNLWHAGEYCLGTGDGDGALALWERSLSIYLELGDEHRAGLVMREVGMCLVRRGELQRGIGMMRQALQISNKRGAKFEIANALWYFGEAAVLDGNQKSALEIFLAAAAVYDAIGTLRSSGLAVLGIASARSWFAQNQATYERAVADKRILSMERAVDFALAYQFVSDSVRRLD